MTDPVSSVHERTWFYEFELPDGTRTESYLPQDAQAVHSTRLEMALSVLEPHYGQRWDRTDVLDLACHQGWFAAQLARRGARQVTGMDARADHVSDSKLICRAMELDNTRFVQCDIDALTGHPDIQPAEVVLMLGLIYHLENPVGAIRAARQMCTGHCIIETQVGPHLSGMLDWGHYEFVRPIQGAFTIIDETDETHANEASTTGICLAPSAETLLWIMRKVGFSDVALVRPPADGYEQHRHYKRVLAVGRVPEETAS